MKSTPSAAYLDPATATFGQEIQRMYEAQAVRKARHE